MLSFICLVLPGTSVLRCLPACNTTELMLCLCVLTILVDLPLCLHIPPAM
jgi:hypothetical protein